MPQLIVFKADNSCSDIIPLSDSLYNKLIENAENFKQEYLTLAFLHETQKRTLFLASKKTQANNQEEVKELASYCFNWFDELTNVINRIETLENPDSFLIDLSD